MMLDDRGTFEVPGASKSSARGMLEGMHLPEPRGPLSAALCTDLAGGTTLSSQTAALAPALPEPADPVDVLRDDDVQLSLAICYELHYRGFDGVDDGWEWEPGLLGVRRELERRHLAGLRALVPAPQEIGRASGRG